MGAFDALWTKSGIVARGPLPLVEQLQKKLPKELGDIGSQLRKSQALVLHKAFASQVNKATSLSLERKQELLVSLNKAIAEFAGGGGQGGGYSGSSGGGGGNDGPGDMGRDPFQPGPIPDPRIEAELVEYFQLPNYQKCVAETALLLTISSAVTAGGAVIVNWQKYAPAGEKNFWKFLRKSFCSADTWLQASGDPEFQHLMTWSTVIMTSLGALSCLGNQKAGRDAITAISFGASVFDQWRTGNYSIRQTLLDVLWIRYVSFYKTTRVLHYSRAYAASGRAHPRLVEAGLQGISELVGAFGFPLANGMSKSLWEQGEIWTKEAQMLWLRRVTR